MKCYSSFKCEDKGKESFFSIVRPIYQAETVEDVISALEFEAKLCREDADAFIKSYPNLTVSYRIVAKHLENAAKEIEGIK